MDKFYEQVGGAVRMQVPLSAPDTKASNTFDVKEWCEGFTRNFGNDVVEPIGSVDARMGIILNQPLLAVEDAGDVLPFGFNETNSLIGLMIPLTLQST